MRSGPVAVPALAPALATAGDDDPVQAALRAKNPADLLAVLPYLFGYQPEDSLVVVVLRDRRLVMGARIDLAAAAEPDALRSRLRAIVAAQSAETVVLIGFGPYPQVRPVLDLVMDDLAAPPEVTVVEALCADGERWWSALCSDHCCPPEGTPYDPGSSPLAAEAVWAGLGAAGSREEIARSITGPVGAERGELRSRVAVVTRAIRGRGLARRRKRVVELVTAGLRLGEGGQFGGEGDDRLGASLDLDERLELALLVGDIAVRDVAWAMISRADAADHVRLWRQVVDVAVPELACPPLCLLGVAAWVSGDGTLQVCCLERAELLDPDYTLVQLLSDLNARAAPPSLWDQIGPALRSELDPWAVGTGRS